MSDTSNTNGFIPQRKFRTLWAGKRLVQVLWNYRFSRNSKVKYKPYRLWIEPTNKCNLACVMCPNKDFKKEDLGFMDFDLFKKIIDEARYFAYDMNIHHRGESNLHPRLPEMIEYATKNGIPVKLHTNGTLLTERRSRELIESGLALISFSFDGYTSDVYEKIRVNANFDKTTRNIVRFLDLKKEMKRATPKTVMEVMEDLEGFEFRNEDKQKFLEMMRDLDRLIVKKPHNWAGYVSIDTFADEDLVACTFPWHAQVILWDGRVGPCPHDYMAEIILGDTKEKSLVEIFNNAETVELRQRHLDLNIRDYSPCNTCDTPRRKKIMGIPAPSLKYLKE
ncbi:radical SAM protein [candidate division KSB1 bacterium]|nr:radical SAM protein [candidate division KSB1 bacterium]